MQKMNSNAGSGGIPFLFLCSFPPWLALGWLENKDIVKWWPQMPPWTPSSRDHLQKKAGPQGD
jgi:hypothetical protein